MADFSEWGPAASGMRVAEQDEQKRQLHEIALAKAPLEREILGSHAQLYRAQAQEKEAKVAEAQRRTQALAAFAQGRQPGARENPVEALTGDLDAMAQLELSLGNVEGARKIAGTLSQIQGREALTELRNTQRDATQLRSIIETNKYLAGFARNAKNQQEWIRAGELAQRVTGVDVSEIFGQPFSPELRDSFVASSMTAAQAATQAFQERRARATEAQVGLAQQRLKLAREVADRTHRLRVQREDRLRKAGGGKAVSAPTKPERDSAGKVIRQQFPGISGAELGAAEDSVIGEAKQLLRGNPGLSWDTAVAQALSKQGEFFETENSMFGKPKTTFRSMGRTPDRAVAFPQKMGDARVGNFYRNDKGVFKYLGNGKLEPVDTDDDDDDEDDE